MELAERVREIRSEAGLTQEGFAQRLGKTTGTIGNWERGETTPDPGTVLLIADVFDVSVDWLRHGTGPMHIDPTSREYAGGKAPTPGSVKKPLAGEGSPGYSVGITTLTIDREDDVQLLPAWAMPIIIGAAAIIIQRVDVERARRAEERGRKYRLRVIVEEHDEDDDQATEPEQPPQGQGL